MKRTCERRDCDGEVQKERCLKCDWKQRWSRSRRRAARRRRGDAELYWSGHLDV